ncbi:MAG: hypothetical protein ACJ74U_20565 [Jatrophihabitantaceae bacterium]
MSYSVGRDGSFLAGSIDRARSFLAGHGRLLERRRFELLAGRCGPEPVLAALDGYRNPDGGYGWGIEPDLRDASSQPAGALHALEVLAELSAAGAEQAVALLDWLAGNSLPDGGLPFALPVLDPAGVAPFWAAADPGSSSLQITAAVAGQAYRLTAVLPELAGHAWLTTATGYCLAAIEGLPDRPGAYELSFALQLLDAVSDRQPAAAELLDRLGRRLLPADGVLPVAGGAAGEVLRALDIAPWPDRPIRKLFAPALIEAEFARLVGEQRPDGGWQPDFDSYSPAGRLDWRGYATVRAVSILLRNGVAADTP